MNTEFIECVTDNRISLGYVYLNVSLCIKVAAKMLRLNTVGSSFCMSVYDLNMG